MTRGIVALTIAVLAMVLAGIASPGAPATDARTAAANVTVRLNEWKVIPSVVRVRAGKVTFVARNVGQLDHNLVVLRTKRAPAKLPIAGAGAKEVGRVGKTPVLRPRQTRRLSLRLKAGKYVLICNVAGHYQAGMFVGFRVS